MLQLFEPYKIDKPIRLIELFAGYGSQALALENLGVDFEHHKVVEFDKYAIKSYNALHGTNFKPQDITKVHDLNIVDKDKYEYILTYSFPCQDLSLAGKGGGMGKGTRSGLLWEVERLLKENALPQVLIMENVTQVHGAKHKEDFNRWIQFLAKLGYSNQWQDLNAKDYGIPQNRNRTFMVSILGDYEYHLPKPIKLKTRLKDYLEDSVDEKYYLSDTVASAVTTRNGSRMDDNFIVDHIGNVDIGNNESNNRVYSKYGLSPTLNTMQGGHRQPKIVVGAAKTSGNDVGVVVGVGHHPTSKKREFNGYGDIVPTLLATDYKAPKTVQYQNLRIRKLTPRECFRLMGLNDNQIDRIFKSGNSNAQLYKQAGNSIVVQVLEAIFKEMIK